MNNQHLTPHQKSIHRKPLPVNDWLDALLTDALDDRSRTSQKQKSAPNTILPGPFSLGSVMLQQLCIKQPSTFIDSSKLSNEEPMIQLRDDSSFEEIQQSVVRFGSNLKQNTVSFLKNQRGGWLHSKFSKIGRRFSLKNISENSLAQKKLLTTTMVGLPIVVFLAVTIIPRLQSEAPQSPGQTLSATFSKQAKHPFYLPEILPQGYQITTNTTVINETISTYSLSNGVNEITITHQQNVPQSALTQLFGNYKAVESAFGTGYIVIDDNEQSKLGGLYTNDVTVFIQSVIEIDANDMRSIISSLRKQ